MLPEITMRMISEIQNTFIADGRFRTNTNSWDGDPSLEVYGTEPPRYVIIWPTGVNTHAVSMGLIDDEQVTHIFGVIRDMIIKRAARWIFEGKTIREAIYEDKQG